MKKYYSILQNFTNLNASILSITLLGLFLRLLILFFYPDQNFPDAQGYTRSGGIFFQTGIFPTDLHMPLYIIWTHLLGAGIWLKISDIILSTLSIILVYRLSLHLFLSKKAACLSSFMLSIYPHCLFYATSRLTETSYVFILLLTFLAFYNNKFLSASILLGLSILIRPTLDLFAPFLVLIFAKIVHKMSWSEVGRKLIIYVICYAGLMTPWWIHNYIKYDTFVRLNLGDGFVLYSGNNPMNRSGGGVAYGNADDDLDVKEFSNIQNPIKRNNAFKEAAINFIKENPKNFLKLMGIKFIRFWRLWPHTTHYQQWSIILISILSYGTILALAICFIFAYGKNYLMIPIYSLAAYLTLVHMVLIGSIRYRFPLEPFLIIMAGFIVAKLWYCPSSYKCKNFYGGEEHALNYENNRVV